MDNHTRYDREVIPGIEESLSRIVEQITEHSVVLDVGCSTGMLGRYLVFQKGCVVDGVDIDEAALENCLPAYRKVIIKNLESDDLTDAFTQEAYDFIVVADVIEHLAQPERLLSQLKLLVKPHGTVIFSVPNITHIAASLELLNGNFEYQGNGLLDSTHIRFYSRQSLLKRLQQSGLYAWKLDHVQKGLTETEFGDRQSQMFPPQWLDALIASREDALVYQWIVTAKIYPSLAAPELNTTEIRAKPLFSTGLYWDDGTGFKESNKVIGLKTGMADMDLIIDFPFEPASERRIQKIRIDPVSAHKSVWIKSAKILDAGDASLWEWPAAPGSADVVSSKWADVVLDSGKILVASNDDPQWHPQIPVEALHALAKGGRLCMVMCDDSGVIDDILTSALAALANSNAALQTEMQQSNERMQKTCCDIMELDTALAEKYFALEKNIAALTEKNPILEHYQAALSEKDAALAERNSALAEKDAALALAHKELTAMLDSRSWKMTAPLRNINRLWKKTD